MTGAHPSTVRHTECKNWQSQHPPKPSVTFKDRLMKTTSKSRLRLASIDHKGTKRKCLEMTDLTGVYEGASSFQLDRSCLEHHGVR
jgi:hypothetical protein